MFEKTIRELKRIGHTKSLSIPIESDEDGYLDKECPVPECMYQFKILEADWKCRAQESPVFCPSCRHEAEAGHWWTTEQLEQAKVAAVAMLSKQLQGTLRADADAWNSRKPRKAFIWMTMRADGRPVHIPLPKAAECMRVKITCAACSCRYAVVGAAFFCPGCGHSAADQAFSGTLDAVRASVASLPCIRTAMPDRDAAEDTSRLLLEGGLQNAVTAFQRFAEVTFEARGTGIAPRRNAFQSLAEGSDLWQRATGKSYTDLVASGDLAALGRYFQQRHLLAHRQGIVDEDYIRKSGDASRRPGQRIVVREQDVLDCVGYIERLARTMSA